MKKISVILLLCLLAFAPEKKYSVEMKVVDWVTYLRCIDRLQSFAGRGNISSDILLSTKDTVTYYQQFFVNDLNRQIADTTTSK